MYSRSRPGARLPRDSGSAAVHVHKELGGAARRARGPDCPGSGEGLRSPEGVVLGGRWLRTRVRAHGSFPNRSDVVSMRRG